MGLGAPKRRSKLSHDPNNTSWAKSTENYGHKILSSQGWKPGDFLGAENASHSNHYTAANASHIRVLLREDNLGLGAKVGKGNAETFGLSLFSGVLGRLNGKSDVELLKQQDALRDAELRTYQTQKYGSMNFVSGGLLVGDRIQPVQEGDASAGKASKKRKAEEVVERSEVEEKHKIKRAKSEIAPDHSLRVQINSTSSAKSKAKKVKTKSKDDRSTAGPVDAGSGVPATVTEQNVDDHSNSVRQAKTKSRKKSRSAVEDEIATGEEVSKVEKTRLKLEKRARKEERRKRKEERRLSGTGRLQSEAPTPPSNNPVSEAKSQTQTQIAPAFGGNRHAVRQRYIQQKRMASLDPQAMKEIFMLKAVG